MNIHVRNVNGSAARWPYPKCNCTYWINHWNNNSSELEPDYCLSCGRIPSGTNILVGGHVQKVFWNGYDYMLDESDETVYVVPVCKSCNGKTDHVFEIDDEYLVPMSKELCVMGY